MFLTENARMLSESAVFFALWTYASPVVSRYHSGHTNANAILVAVQKRFRDPCPNL